MPVLKAEVRDPDMPYLEPEERVVGEKYSREQDVVSPSSSIPPKKRKFNLYSEIIQDAMHSSFD